MMVGHRDEVQQKNQMYSTKCQRTAAKYFNFVEPHFVRIVYGSLCAPSDVKIFHR